MYISALYLILFLISLIASFYLLENIATQRSRYYIVLFILISVVCLAYFAYSTALDTGMALVANQFSYIDGTYVLMFFLFCVLDICGITVKKRLSIPLTLIGTFFLGLAFTAGYNQLFYKSIGYGVYKGAAHLETELGPLYSWYVAYVVIVTLAPIAIIIYSLFNKKKISIKYTFGLGAIQVAIVLLYFVESNLGLGFDLLPVGYVLMEVVILHIIQRIALYDGAQIVIDNSESKQEFGYIIFDNHKAYIGSNPMAKYFFPELDELEVDRQVNNEFIRTEFVDRIENNEVGSKTYARNGRMIVCSIKPYIPKKSNKIYGYMVELRDDTEQQEHIQALNSMNEDLAYAVESANRANNAKSDFLASMSHEIRTPINAILGMNEIALRECNDDKIVSYLNEIKTAGSNLLYIINDILDFSKIEAGKIEIVNVDYDIYKTINDVKELLDIKAREKNLELIVNVDKQLPRILNGDENRIRQILINILNNAVKYTREGKVELTVKVEVLDKDKCNLSLVVQDTGIGIKAENIPFLFDSFSRMDGEKNRHIEGTGLGLAITKNLIEKMEGTVDVSSIYGEGTTFTVVLPQTIIKQNSDNDAYDDISRKPSDEHIDASSLNILVVDDNRVNLMVAQGLLKQTKAQVQTCKSGEECLELITKNYFDVILLDHMMPGMDGIETLHKAMEMDNNRCDKSAYIALTANAISGVRDMYISEGFDDYISKPIDSKLLENVLARYIK